MTYSYIVLSSVLSLLIAILVGVNWPKSYVLSQEFIPVRQQRGDAKCLSACVASLLHLKLNEVPFFECPYIEGQLNELTEWLNTKGYDTVVFSGPFYQIRFGGDNSFGLDQFFDIGTIKDKYCIICGPTETSNHAVLGKISNGMVEFIHDPDVENAFLYLHEDTICYFVFITKLTEIRHFPK